MFSFQPNRDQCHGKSEVSRIIFFSSDMKQNARKEYFQWTDMLDSYEYTLHTDKQKDNCYIDVSYVHFILYICHKFETNQNDLVAVREWKKRWSNEGLCVSTFPWLRSAKRHTFRRQADEIEFRKLLEPITMALLRIYCAHDRVHCIWNENSMNTTICTMWSGLLILASMGNFDGEWCTDTLKHKTKAQLCSRFYSFTHCKL